MKVVVQLLVVVANIQMRTLKAEVEKGSARTAFVRRLVDPKAHPNGVVNVLRLWRGVPACLVRSASWRTTPKGNQAKIPEPGCGYAGAGSPAARESGNTNERGDASRGPGKSYLFFLTICKHYNA